MPLSLWHVFRIQESKLAPRTLATLRDELGSGGAVNLQLAGSIALRDLIKNAYML